MSKHLINAGRDRPLLDIATYARKGPGERTYLSPAEVEQITLTIRRAPEVMVKVLTRGGQDLGAVRRHFAYLNRQGELEVKTDDGQRLSGQSVQNELVEDWDLDLEEHRRTLDLEPRSRRPPPKLIHKLLFSMPPGTSPQKVLAAVRDFAREEFELKHRYAIVLHTDEPHPHVHMVVKAMSERGVRLHIRKATLRDWRREFARHLRRQGVAANATERAVRGQSRSAKSDPIYRAACRGHSTHMRDRVERVAREIREGALATDHGKERLLRTRAEVTNGWRAVSDMLVNTGRPELASQVSQFVGEMPPPRSERDWLAHSLLSQMRSVRLSEGRMDR